MTGSALAPAVSSLTSLTPRATAKLLRTSTKTVIRNGSPRHRFAETRKSRFTASPEAIRPGAFFVQIYQTEL